jgi:hypothetical protein
MQARSNLAPGMQPGWVDSSMAYYALTHLRRFGGTVDSNHRRSRWLQVGVGALLGLVGVAALTVAVGAQEPVRDWIVGYDEPADGSGADGLPVIVGDTDISLDPDVTLDDYRQAVAASVACIEEVGYDVPAVWPHPDGRQYAYAYFSSRPGGPTVEEKVAAQVCYQKWEAQAHTSFSLLSGGGAPLAAELSAFVSCVELDGDDMLSTALGAAAGKPIDREVASQANAVILGLVGDPANSTRLAACVPSSFGLLDEEVPQ